MLSGCGRGCQTRKGTNDGVFRAQHVWEGYESRWRWKHTNGGVFHVQRVWGSTKPHQRGCADMFEGIWKTPNTKWHQRGCLLCSACVVLRRNNAGQKMTHVGVFSCLACVVLQKNNAEHEKNTNIGVISSSACIVGRWNDTEHEKTPRLVSFQVRRVVGV